MFAFVSVFYAVHFFCFCLCLGELLYSASFYGSYYHTEVVVIRDFPKLHGQHEMEPRDGDGLYMVVSGDIIRSVCI